MNKSADIICYMSKLKRHFLFDLDGTLSESRKKVGTSMGSLLRDISKFGSIVIVSGSDYDFITDQMETAWSYLSCDLVTLLPCNGTKRYEWSPKAFASKFELVESLDMKNHMGKEKYASLVQFLILKQSEFLKKEEISHFCSGQFISYRESMINWAPVGRNGSFEDREAFVEFDKSTNFRNKMQKEILNFIRENDLKVQVALGGDTSFDIFPSGWDKTISLRFFDETDTLYFFGDRCYPGGNDFEIYNSVSRRGHAYKVNGPEDTIEYLKQILKELKNELD